MLVVERNRTYVNWSLGDPVKPMSYAGDVVVTFDPSKSNMAMLVGTPTGTILNAIEFSGNNRKRGPVMDTTLYCEEVRTFLGNYLSQCNLYCVAVEQAITKQGHNFHHSNMVLTEIRANILNFFMERFGVKVLEINNWSWKSNQLPKGYRSISEKGSKRYFVENFPDSEFANYFEADMTDCVCIYNYVISKHCANYSVYCNRAEQKFTDYSYSFMPESCSATDNLQEVVYNSRFTLDENLAFYTNRILGVYWMKLPIERVDIATVYGRSMLFTLDDFNSEYVKVVAKRK